MLLLMETRDQDSLSALFQHMEEWRQRLYDALDEAGGNQLDPRVQTISQEFDRAMNRWMRKKREADQG